MRVFIAVTSLRAAYGGPSYSVARLASSLADAGVDVGLWAPDGSADAAAAIPAGSRVLRLTDTASREMERFGPVDLVHDNGLWLPHNHWLARECRNQRIARVVSTRGMLEPWALAHKRWRKRAAWVIYQRSDLRSAQALHATAASEAANLERFDFGIPIHVIANGVDLPASDDVARSAPSSGSKTMLFMGRLYPVKGLPMLIKAWECVRPAGWRLRIVGPDEAGHLGELVRLVDAAGLGDAISFPGPVSGEAKRAAFMESDLLVLPSHSESFGIAVAEALAHGLPALATTATPWPMLEERRCGWLAEPTVEGLAQALRRATATDTAELREMGRRGREFVSAAFGWDSIARAMIGVYEEALRAQRGGRNRPAGETSVRANAAS